MQVFSNVGHCVHEDAPSKQWFVCDILFSPLFFGVCLGFAPMLPFPHTRYTIVYASRPRSLTNDVLVIRGFFGGGFWFGLSVFQAPSQILSQSLRLGTDLERARRRAHRRQSEAHSLFFIFC